ncbi:MAG: glycosyltransferase [Oxalobacteraceae bacterium]|jgi:4-amino-4-deoxy-L-arabinose transferase-like glycosyltransferase|nr:glycosyltransferase [Oxalobacteraceae bacterium]
MKPVRLSAAATIALPRWGLIALCLLYILPGIVRRDPWKVDDASGFGIMWTMAHGALSDWLSPNIVGMGMPNEAPLTYWIGAILIRVFGWLTGDALAARLSILVFFAIGTLAVWRTAYVLGRRSESQPLKLAFGGQPAAMDYGRTLADGALLIYVASLGLLLRSHETAATALQVSMVAVVMYAAACLFDRPTARAATGLGVATGLLLLTANWITPLLLFVSFVLVAALRYREVLPKLLMISLPIMMALPAAWLLSRQVTTMASVADWLAIGRRELGMASTSNTRELLKTSVWYLWPAWPIAAWAVYAWRSQLTLHILLPAAVVAGLALMTLFSPSARDHALLPLLPPLAILATFGLPTLKRGAINAIDWFSVMTLSAIAGFIWLGWLAKQTGWPPQLAHNAFRAAPGFQPEFSSVALAVALMTSVGWLLLLYWRLGRRPPVLWRAVVLSTGGIVLCWVLLMTLWLPWLNYRQSYAAVAEQLGAALPSTYRCVDTDEVGPAQRASFAYLGHVKFSRPGDKRCEFLLVQDDRLLSKGGQMKSVDDRLTLLWQGRRAADRHELFRLFRRDSR